MVRAIISVATVLSAIVMAGPSPAFAQGSLDSSAPEPRLALVSRRDSLPVQYIQQLEERYAAIYHAAIVYEEVSNADTDTLSRICDQDHVAGVIAAGVSHDMVMVVARTQRITLYPSAGVGLLDCNGHQWQYFNASESASIGSIDDAMARFAQLDGTLVKSVLDRSERDAQSHPSAAANFARSGIYSDDEIKDPLFALKAAAGGAAVTWASPIGAAARAGLQVGDLVTALDGQNIAGLDQSGIDKMMSDVRSKPFNVAALDANAKSVSFDVVPQPTRWYIEHPTPAVRPSARPTPTPTKNPHKTATPRPSPPPVAGARRLAFIGLGPADGSMTTTMFRELYDRLQQRLASLYHSQIVFEETADVAKGCKDANAVGAIVISLPGAYMTRIDDLLYGKVYGEAVLRGCDGHGWQAATATLVAPVASSSAPDVLHDFRGRVADALVTRLEAGAERQRAAIDNFVRYGVYLDRGAKDAFFRLEAVYDAAARVTWVMSTGTAARAGLQTRDRVTDINGRSVVGLSQEALDALVARANSAGKIQLTVENEGKPATRLSIDAQDAGWYAAHGEPR